MILSKCVRMNPFSGSMWYIPQNLLVQQYDYYGKFQNGFWNSIIFQNDVSQASQGNGYIAMDDDVWIYTGVTSSESDASNFGFILSNQRTKETRYYENGGAIETACPAVRGRRGAELPVCRHIPDSSGY